MTSETPTATSVYNAATNRITPFSYDQRGNVTAVPGRTTTYDGENRQITAVAHSVSSTYAYDGEGRRVSKTVGGVTTVFVYDAMGQLAAEYGPASSETGRQYFTADHLGSTRLVTDAGGSVTKTLDYLPFGEELNVACFAAPGGVKFTGQYRDQETCEDYFEARYYSAAQGRFTSPDVPFADQSADDPQSWNLYGYVRNSPLIYSDPSGNECVDGLEAGTTDKPCKVVSSVTVSANATNLATEVSNIGQQLLLRSLEGLAPAVTKTAEILQPVTDFLTKPRDPGCMAAATGGVAASGMALGGMAGLAGGPGAFATVPAGSATGFLLGGAAGWAGGLASCMSGTGSGGGEEGNRASGSEARLTKPQQRQTAEHLGMKEVRGMTSQGQPVFEKGGRYFSFSNTGHTAGEVFKELDRSGNRIATTDLNLNRIGR